MFTGLIDNTGRILYRGGNRLEIETARVYPQPVRGESIAVNGCCLTVEQFEGRRIVFHTLQETLDRTNLGALPPGGGVNLERALKWGDRLGGHLVTGHIDSTGRVVSCRRRAGDVALTVAFPPELRDFLAPKGSIALDGVSLTVAELTGDTVTVCLIPVTLDDTMLRERVPSDPVNIETDLIGKYVAGQLARTRGNGSITMEKLRENGFL